MNKILNLPTLPCHSLYLKVDIINYLYVSVRNIFIMYGYKQKNYKKKLKRKKIMSHIR